YGQNADLGVKEVEELRGVRDWYIDVLDHRLGMHAGEPVPRTRQAPAAVPAHHLLVEDRVEPLAAVEPAQQRMLRADVFRAPEPVGVPAPEIIADGQIVARAFADRAVVDPFVGVVTGIRRAVDEGPPGEIELAGREDHAVEEVA